MPQMFDYSSKRLLFPRSWNYIVGLLYSGGLAVLGNFECRLEVTMVFMWQFMVKKSLAVLIPKDALFVWTNLGKHFVVRLVMRLRNITTLSSGFRILRVWWRFVHVAVLSFIWRLREREWEEIVNEECILLHPTSETASSNRRHDPVSRNTHIK